MRESEVESHLRLSVEGAGGMCEKFVSPGRRGVPDRVASWPGGRVDWIETKAPGGKLKSHQRRDHARRRALGQKVFVLGSIEAVDWYMDTGRYLTWTEYCAHVRAEGWA